MKGVVTHADMDVRIWMSAARSVYGRQRSKGSCGKSLGAISWWLGGAVTYICSMKPDCLNMLDGGKMKGITTREA